MPTLKVNEIISYSGNTLSLGTSGDTVTVPANVTFNALGANVYIPSAIAKLDAITPTNTSTYNLTYGGSPYSPASATACLVSLNGIIQAPTTAFTVSANTISFSTALTSTDVIDFITVLAAPYTLNVPGDGTVGITKLSATGTPSSSTYLRGDNTWAAVASPIVWNQTVQSTNFTASVNVGYMVNTTTAAVTVTLPASPSIGDQIQFVDFQETAATNNIILNPNGLKIDGTTETTRIVNGGEGVTIMYSGTTRGWIPVSAANEGTTALASQFSLDFLVVAGGGGGGYGSGGGGGGAGGYRTSTQSVLPGTVITVTVGDGGAGTGNDTIKGSSGSNSSISGSGLTTITSAGGGGGASGNALVGASGGSGGGAFGGAVGGDTGGSGNTPSTSPSQGNNGGSGLEGTSGNRPSGGGGGAGAVGGNGSTGTSTSGNGGAGTASSITGSSVTYAGGGGGGIANNGTAAGTGGSGGGGNGAKGGVSSAVAGTANLGGGGGGGSDFTDARGGAAGGKGVVIISLATIHYSGTSSGSPTVTTSGSNTILTFNGSGTYTV